MSKMKSDLQNTKNKIKPVGVALLGDPIPERNTQSGIALMYIF